MLEHSLFKEHDQCPFIVDEWQIMTKSKISMQCNLFNVKIKISPGTMDPQGWISEASILILLTCNQFTLKKLCDASADIT